MKHPIWASMLVMIKRVQGWLGIINFAMIVYLFAAQSGVDIPFFLFAIVIIMGVVGFLDFKYIFPHETKRAASKNPVFMEILGTVRRIERKMKS